MHIGMWIDSEVKEGRRGIYLDEVLSHHGQESELRDILGSARQQLWKSSEAAGQAIGEKLFQLLNGSGGQLRKRLDDAFKSGERLYLDFTIPFELDALPVELLYDHSFFLLNSQTHITRKVTDRNRLQGAEPQKRPLQMLFLACSPIDLPDAVLQFEKEEETILHHVERLQVDMSIEDSGSLDGLEEALIEANGYDVIHMTGHATVDSKLGPVFYMEDEIGRLDRATPARLWQALRDYPPRLLFLSGCSTGKSDKTNASESFAHRLVEYGIPTVLGWGLPVSDSGATRLTGELYKYLGQGKPIDFATQRACQAMADSYHTWPLLRVFNDGSPWAPIIAPGQKARRKAARQTTYTYLEDSQVKVLASGFIGRRREIQQGIKVLKGDADKNGLLIHGPAGVGKSCLAGKLIERFADKQLIVLHGELEKVAILEHLRKLFDRLGSKEGLEIIDAEREYEDRIKALWRSVFKQQETVFYFDDFEQNLERVGDAYQVKAAVIETIKPVLSALDWAEGASNLMITSRYPFVMEVGGEYLPAEKLQAISLMSLKGPDLEKKKNSLEHIAKSPHSGLYVDVGKGNPRLLEWLEKIAGDEDQYDLDGLKKALQGKSEDYVRDYLTEIMAQTQGEAFHQFLRQAAVYRQPVEATAFESFGSETLLNQGVALTLLEREQAPGQAAVYWVMPVIRESQWALLTTDQKPALHQTAYAWYAARIDAQEARDYRDREEAVYHALASGNIAGACKQAIPLGTYLSDRLLYQDHLRLQQQVADQITQEDIDAAINAKDDYVGTLFNELGLVLANLGDAKKAIEYYEQAVAIDLAVFGEQHPNVAIRYNNLGEAWRHLGNAKKAIDHYEQALAIDRAVLGEQHPKVAIRYNNLGIAWADLGKAQKAIEYYEQAVAIDLAVFGEQHPKVAIRYNNFGAAWADLGDVKKAIGYFESALAIDLGVFGEKHPNVAMDYANLGAACRMLGEAQKAIEYHEQALAIDIAVFGEQHPNVARDYNNLGVAQRELRDVKKAIGYFESALAIDLGVFGEQHPNVAIRYNNLGEAWRHLGDAKKAIEYYEQALDIITAVYGSDHPQTQLVQKNLSTLKQNLFSEY